MKKFKLSNEQELEICEKYVTQIISAENLGKIYGVSENPILNILKKYNIKPKTTYEHMGYKFSKEQMFNIINEYLNGVNQNTLEKKFRINRKVIRKLLIKNEIKIRNRRKIKESNFKRIIDFYTKEYLSTEEIAKKYNVTHVTILKILWENNIKMRKFGEGSKIFSPKDELEVCNLYIKENKSIVEISKLYNCTPGPVSRILKKNNIEIKKTIHRTSWGISGFYKNIHFRSMIELSFIINYLEKKNISFKSENEIQGIKYYHSEDKKIRLYYPDFITDKYMFEIKPKGLWNTQKNIDKYIAAQKYCQLNNLKYRFVDYPIMIKSIVNEFFNNKIKFSNSGLEKFLRIYDKYLPK